MEDQPETMEEVEAEVEVEMDIMEPVIVNLGKKRRKLIKQLLKGEGKLAEEIDGVIDEVAEMLGEELDGKTLVPLILIYEKKPKKNRGFFGA